MNAVTEPLYIAANYFERISKGDIPDELTNDFKGDFNKIKENLNTCISAINLLIQDTNMLSLAAVEGKLSARADSKKHGGDFAKIIEGINNTLDAVVSPINVTAENLARISSGDIPEKITVTYNGDFNSIINNLNTCIAAINAMIEDTYTLASAAEEGQLSLRADESKHHGDFRRIVAGINRTLDSVVLPLNTAADYIDKISMGEIPEFITEKFNGDFNSIINNLNTCISAINLLISDAGMLSTAAVEGRLSVRANVNKHGGDFRKIIEGVNNSLDAVINPLNNAAQYINKISRGDIPPEITEEYAGDFNSLKSSLNICIKAINLLVEDTQKLSTSAVEGNLSLRADISKHQGEYKIIVEGINNTLDSVITPVKEGVEALKKMAEGDLTIKIESDYKGDHQILKNSINTVSASLNKAMTDVIDAIELTASASNRISSSTEEMAAGAQEQTMQATEVSSSVEEMTKTILDNTKNTSFASETAKNAGNMAKEGGNVVRKTIAGMNRISEVVTKSAETVKALGSSSDQIGEIIQVIDDIADQTNLLALNAAIEAARAGEQGRGFAVVADEVRKLAERTTKATKEIADMIKQIQKDTTEAVNSMQEGTTEVENGKQMANKAGESLEEIIKGAERVVDIITQVAAASEEQSSSSELITRNIEAITTVTHETATGIQHIAKAAEDLNRLTLNLENLVNRFTITKEKKEDLFIEKI